jgi:long-subunit fatty acid transport protein
MGGAFIAVADDATAASWNPGGLIQLERPEISAVGAYFHRSEDISFGTNPEGNGPQSVSQTDLNYFSVAYPFNLLDRNMIISLNYQHLFNLDRKWSFSLLDEVAENNIWSKTINNEQDGGIYALGLAYSIQVLPELSLGFTLNFWEDLLYDNEWNRSHHEIISGTALSGSGIPLLLEENSTDHYSFRGFNFNLGLLWHATARLTVGAVFKSPFTADLGHTSTSYRLMESPAFPESAVSEFGISSADEELDMPMSYGIGLAYRFSDEFTVSGDIYRTHWQDFKHTDADGRETSPISGLSIDDSDVDATFQIRLGAEYLFVKRKYVIPVRTGLFYDPAPAEGSPDDIFGFSVGTGFAVNRFAFDAAYQYRFGRDIGGSILGERDFSMDMDEHTIYSSLIFYF